MRFIRSTAVALLLSLSLVAPTLAGGGASVAVTTPPPYVYGQTITVQYTKFTGGGGVYVKCYQGDTLVYRRAYNTSAFYPTLSRDFVLSDVYNQTWYEGTTLMEPYWDGQAASCFAYIAKWSTTGKGYKETLVASTPFFDVAPAP